MKSGKKKHFPPVQESTSTIHNGGLAKLPFAILASSGPLGTSEMLHELGEVRLPEHGGSCLGKQL